MALHGHKLVSIARNHASHQRKRKFPRFSAKGKSKFSRVMREGFAGKLHHGRSGKIVPRSRPDIMKAIAASEARRA